MHGTGIQRKLKPCGLHRIVGSNPTSSTVECPRSSGDRTLRFERRCRGCNSYRGRWVKGNTMKVIFAIAVIMSLCSCTAPQVGCSKDADCKGTRICKDGECVEGNTVPTPDPSGVGQQPDGGYPTGTSGYSCGIVDISCNCSGTTAYPNEIVATKLCSSGYHIFQTCGYCQGGGYAWLTKCYCQ